jgi:hypothetical protein
VPSTFWPPTVLSSTFRKRSLFYQLTLTQPFQMGASWKTPRRRRAKNTKLLLTVNRKNWTK